MHIALVTDGIWPYVLGGMQKHSYYLCKYLAANKVHVDLFHFNNSSYPIEELAFFSAEERLYIHPFLVPFSRSFSFPGHYLYDSYQYSERVARLILPISSKYDLIYTKGFTGWRLIEQKQKTKLPPIGVNFHGYEMFQKLPDFKTWLQALLLLRRPVKMLTKRADFVFSYGGKITQLIRSLGVTGERIVEMPTGVEKSLISEGIMPTSGVVRFVFLGRYERRKGIEELNTAIRLLSTSLLEQSEFHFIGPVPAEKQLPGCRYHGEIRDRERITHLLRGCDILLCPSWSEGMPNVILEGMAQGLAVVATDVGATSLLVSSDTGWLLSDSSAESVKAAVTEAIQMDRAKIDTRKHNALRLISEEFVWEKIVNRLMLNLDKMVRTAKTEEGK